MQRSTGTTAEVFTGTSRNLSSAEGAYSVSCMSSASIGCHSRLVPFKHIVDRFAHFPSFVGAG